MTDNKSPGDRLLELMVFGPTGLAVTLVEEFPKFVEKGRHRVEGQVHTARLLGQFAVQMGRRQLEQSLAHFGGAPDVGVPRHDTEYARLPSTPTMSRTTTPSTTTLRTTTPSTTMSRTGGPTSPLAVCSRAGAPATAGAPHPRRCPPRRRCG